MDFTKNPDDGFPAIPEEERGETSETVVEGPSLPLASSAETAFAQLLTEERPPDPPMQGVASESTSESVDQLEGLFEGGVPTVSAAAEQEAAAVPSSQPLPPVSSLGQPLRPRAIAASYSLTAPGSETHQLFLFPDLSIRPEECPPDFHANASTLVVKPHAHPGTAGADLSDAAEDHSWSFLQEAKSLARDIVFAIVAAVLIVWFVVQPVKVQGTSMLPELKDGERIFVNKFIYSFETIERGDIVVFWYPKDPEKSFIKRVIGLPGDDIRIDGGHVYVNSRLYSEPYLDPEHTRMPMAPMSVRVDDHHYFVMGDNRDASNDSRSWGLVPEKYIYGKAMFRYWPVQDFGPIGSEGHE